MSEARRGIAAYESELRQSRQAARELVALAVPATVVRSALELDADLELAKAQPGDRQVGLDARAPERDSRARAGGARCSGDSSPQRARARRRPRARQGAAGRSPGWPRCAGTRT